MAAQKEQLKFSNYRLTSEQGICVSCYRAVPIFAAKDPFLEPAIYTANTQQYNLLEKICIDCTIHHMERIRSLPLYHSFELAAKKNNNFHYENYHNNVEKLEQFNLRDSTGSNSSAGICDFEVKENHEFWDDNLVSVQDTTAPQNCNDEENSSRFIRVTERYIFHDGSKSNDSDATGLFKDIKKHVNYPNYLHTPNDLNELTNPIPFTLPAGFLMSKKVKIEEKMNPKPDPDFIFENYEYHNNANNDPNY